MNIPYERILLVKIMVPQETDLEAVHGQLEKLLDDLKGTPESEPGPIIIEQRSMMDEDLDDWIWAQEVA